jgi:hypothetical protein
MNREKCGEEKRVEKQKLERGKNVKKKKKIVQTFPSEL